MSLKSNSPKKKLNNSKSLSERCSTVKSEKPPILNSDISHVVKPQKLRKTIKFDKIDNGLKRLSVEESL